MVSSLHSLDLRTYEWYRAFPTSDTTDSGPRPRYFHSATAWDDKLVIFGGQALRADVDAAEGSAQLKTLADIAIWDTTTRIWTIPTPALASGMLPPPPRYAHLAVVSEAFSGHDSSSAAARLTIIGGQDDNNAYITSMHTLDLKRMEWVAEQQLPRHVGAYRSVAATSGCNIVQRDPRNGVESGAVHSVKSSLDDSVPTLLFTNAASSSKSVPSPAVLDVACR